MNIYKSKDEINEISESWDGARRYYLIVHTMTYFVAMLWIFLRFTSTSSNY